jgi:hypothetical protein
MSLAVLADHMASKGRGPDSMLIHMSPREVQGLQSLAMAHGGSLTVNPETGLPEAGFLDKLLPTIIGAGLSFIPGVGPLMAAGIVGGIQTVRTGDIGKGLAAGLGAYGGAGLTAGLTEAGASTIGAAEAAKGLTMTPELAAELEIAGAGAKDTLLQQQVADKMAAATPYEKLSSGFDAFKNNPMGMTKSLASPLMMAAGPAILAGANVQSKGPQTITKPGMIRPYSFDPYGGTYTAGTPYEAMPTKAADGGLMGMDDGGYNPGRLNFTGGGEPVVRMAEGGVPGYANGMLVGDQDVFNYFKGLDQTKLASGALDAQIAADMQKYNVGAADIGRITGTQANQSDFEKRFVQAINPATLSSADFLAKTADVGLTDQALANAMKNAGMSTAAQYAATHALDDTAGIATAPKAAQDFYNAYGYKAGDAPGDAGGIAGLYTNIGYAANKLQDQINAGKLTVAQAQNLSLAEMERLGINQADIKAATGKNFADLFTPKTEAKTPIVCGPGYQLNAAGTACELIPVVKPPPLPPPTTIIPGVNDYGLGGTGTSGRLESIYGPSLPPGVSGAGITTVNPNGTITTRPNIPGIPEGGFTGMTSLRDAYEKGGGSLGVNKNLFAPKTQDELFARYKNTGGSKAALDYLMGKIPYSPVPVTPTGEIMKPYWESVGRFPAQDKNKNKKYIYDGTKYVLNPDYVKPSYVLAGEKAAALTNQDKEPTESPGAGNKWTWNSVDKKWEAKPISAAADTNNQLDSSSTGGEANGGLMAMASGGMAGQFDLGGYSDGGRLLRGPGDGVSDSIPATIGNKRPARLADGEFVVPARIVSELGNGSTEAGARKLYAMMDRVQKARRGTVGKGKVAKNSRSDKYLPA